MIRLTGSHSKIVFKPLPADDPTQRRPDIELACQKLDWQPAIELEEGLRWTIEYFKNFIADEQAASRGAPWADKATPPQPVIELLFRGETHAGTTVPKTSLSN